MISAENIGQNAYARAFGLTTAPYLIELDNDPRRRPTGLGRTMLDAFKRLPDVGFLQRISRTIRMTWPPATGIHRPHEYTLVEEHGVRLLHGPAGGGCAITSRELNEHVGGFRQDKKQVFWLGVGLHRRPRAGRVSGRPSSRRTLESITRAGLATRRRRSRRPSTGSAGSSAWHGGRGQRALVHVPFVRRLDARFGWFVARCRSARSRSGAAL